MIAPAIRWQSDDLYNIYNEESYKVFISQSKEIGNKEWVRLCSFNYYYSGCNDFLLKTHLTITFG